MNPSSVSVLNGGTSLNFDAQTYLDQDEADIQKEEKERENEVIIMIVLIILMSL